MALRLPASQPPPPPPPLLLPPPPVEDCSAAVEDSAEPVSGVVTSSISNTVTRWCALAALPELSLAAHLTTVVPTGNGPPISGAAVTFPSTRSSASACPIFTLVSAPLACCVISAGGIITGGVVSVIVTSCWSLPALPDESVAVQTTVCRPTVNGPAGFAVTGTAPSTSSNAQLCLHLQ